MDLKEFKQEVLTHYLDQDLQVTIDRDPGKWSTGNGLLYAGIFYTILSINHAIEDSDRARFQAMVELCWVKNHPGLLNRNLGRTDLEAHDDYIGVCTAGYCLRSAVPKTIYDYGCNSSWSFNNVRPGKFTLQTYHGRLSGLIAFYSLAASQPPGWFQNALAWAALQLPPSDNHSNNTLTWLKALIYYWQSSFLHDATIGCQVALELKYGTLGSLFKYGFGADHPFSRIPNMSGKLP